ncbi:hypothetical protein GJV85_05540 [Sulfurimonas aquatica]|uniref:Lipoprotein n=1 Tax=Sulfurimonas aquatica TaxID=2672570 RepID=A0A975AZS9_9BACT|nr:hypothetical protein [Sulfurimonas aquatica]QSZ41591.1 hypothetical protein GJV85_05540 [Sulfurimonas aquatica]
MKYLYFIALVPVVFFSACSTKEVYEPKQVASEWKSHNRYKNQIIDTSANVALLEDMSVLTASGNLKVDINASHRLISQSDGWIITASIDGDLLLTSKDDSSKVKSFNLKKTVAGASVNADDLAVIFADNEIAIYDIPTKELLFKEQGAKYLAADSRIVNPHFMKELVLFSTLDGKVIIVNNTLKKRLRTVIVSSEDSFNNVIALAIVDNKIIASTGYKLLSMSQKEIRAKYEIRNVTNDENSIFIATKQGEIISLTPDLQVNSKVKLPFAHFYGIISSGDKLYVLEKEGYLIVVDKKSFEYTVHEVDFDDGLVFTADSAFYVNDKKISIE